MTTLFEGGHNKEYSNCSIGCLVNLEGLLLDRDPVDLTHEYYSRQGPFPFGLFGSHFEAVESPKSKMMAVSDLLAILRCFVHLFC